MPKSGDSGFRSPVDMAQDALRDFQTGPKIQRPNLAQSFIPIVGPAWEAAGDLQDGHYGAAAFNTAMAIGDALPVGAIVKGARAASKDIGILKKGSVSAGAAAKQIRKAGLAGKGEESSFYTPERDEPVSAGLEKPLCVAENLAQGNSPSTHRQLERKAPVRSHSAPVARDNRLAKIRPGGHRIVCSRRLGKRDPTVHRAANQVALEIGTSRQRQTDLCFCFVQENLYEIQRSRLQVSHAWIHS